MLRREIAGPYLLSFYAAISSAEFSMGRIEKTVFISYRRVNVAWALAIFQSLTNQGYDVFFDYSGTASGDSSQSF